MQVLGRQGLHVGAEVHDTWTAGNVRKVYSYVGAVRKDSGDLNRNEREKETETEGKAWNESKYSIFTIKNNKVANNMNIM